MKEIVFVVGGEGGSLEISRELDKNGYKFFYNQCEFDPTDDGLGVNINKGYESFEEPFQIINTSFPWYKLYVELVHIDYREYVINELIKILNKKDLTPEDIYSNGQLEKVLNIKLEYGNVPIINSIQNIKIEFYNGKTFEYEYSNMSTEYYSDGIRSDDLKLYKKLENVDWKIIKCKGTVHFSGSTVIIRDQNDQPTHIFNSEKAFVTTTPIMSNTKGWYFSNY